MACTSSLRMPLLRCTRALADADHLLAVKFEIDAIGLGWRVEIEATMRSPGDSLIVAGFNLCDWHVALTAATEHRHTAKSSIGRCLKPDSFYSCAPNVNWFLLILRIPAAVGRVIESA